MKKSIGVIDSGVGGLTVVKEMLENLPNESIIYLGDNKRCPYGTRSADEVEIFTHQMVAKLSEENIKLLVIACNTATAVALESIRDVYDFPVVGVIVPGARAALNYSKQRHIAVLGTNRTIETDVYKHEILRQASDASVYSLACPEFVPIVESGQYRLESSKAQVQQRLEQLAPYPFDVAILGCTHYPLLENHIKASLPDNVNIISSAVETVRDVKQELSQRRLLNPSTNERTLRFYTTGEIKSFYDIVQDWLSIDHPIVEQVYL